MSDRIPTDRARIARVLSPEEQDIVNAEADRMVARIRELEQQLATARERVRELENENAALRPSAENYHRQRIGKEQAEARERAVTKLLALHEECDDDVPCSILSDLRALFAPPAPAP